MSYILTTIDGVLDRFGNVEFTVYTTDQNCSPVEMKEVDMKNPDFMQFRKKIEKAKKQIGADLAKERETLLKKAKVKSANGGLQFVFSGGNSVMVPDALGAENVFCSERVDGFLHIGWRTLLSFDTKDGMILKDNKDKKVAEIPADSWGFVSQGADNEIGIGIMRR